MGQLLVTLKRSAAGRPSRQLETVKGLGLRRLGAQRVLENTPAVRGMVAKVMHLVDVQEVE